MFGTVGGLVEHRSALLASRGFATMALSYFTPPKKGSKSRDVFDLTDLMYTDMEYFIEAMEILLGHEQVLFHGVGVIGTSKGADLGCLLSVCSEKASNI